MPDVLGSLRGIGMVGLFEDCRHLVQGSCLGGVWSRVVRFETGRQLIDQARLTLDQRVLIARERFEFLDLCRVRLQSS